MSHPPIDRPSSFILEGHFQGFIWHDGKLKYLRVAASEQELIIKLSKQARASLGTTLHPNDWIQVLGRVKVDERAGELKLKAEQITKKPAPFVDLTPLEATEPCTPAECPEAEALTCPNSSDGQPLCHKPTAKLLVCQKSSCQKKGGKKQHQAIATILRDRGLHDHVTIQGTGCLGKCAMAPNIVLMPGKKRLSGMKPEAIVALLEELYSR